MKIVLYAVLFVALVTFSCAESYSVRRHAQELLGATEDEDTFSYQPEESFRQRRMWVENARVNSKAGKSSSGSGKGYKRAKGAKKSKPCEDQVKQLTRADCNTVLTTDAVLTENMYCKCDRTKQETSPPASYALTIQANGVELDMNGYTISCNVTWPKMPPTDPVRAYLDFADDECEMDDRFAYADKSACIKVLGNSVLVKDGTLEMCSFGLVTTGNFAEIYNLNVKKTFNDAVELIGNTNYVHDTYIEQAGNSFNAAEAKEFCELPTTMGRDRAWCDFHDGNPDPSAFTGDGLDVDLNSNGNRIIGNYIYKAADDGMDVDGSFNTIQENIIESTVYEDCLVSRGSGNIIHDNYLHDCAGDGMDIKFNRAFLGPGNCEEGKEQGGCCHSIVGNWIDITRGGRGIRLENDGPNHVAENLVTRPFESCFRADDGEDGGNDNVFLMNSCRGSQIERGFRIDGDGNLVKLNSAVGNADNGFEVDGGSNNIVCNRATENEANGFSNEGRDNTFIGNEASRNKQSGFSNDGRDATYKENRAFRNEEFGFADFRQDATYENNIAKNNKLGNDIPNFVTR